jgi:cytochrome c-type biogenesis protein CcmH
MWKRFLTGLALGLGLFLAVRAAWAQTPAPAVSDDEVNRVAKQMFCPVCENVPLDVCPTEACRQWRQTIREKLEIGWTDQQIKDYFVEQYGERVLAEPSTRGLNIFVWVLPPLGVLIGGVVLWRVLRQMAPRPAPASAPPPAAAADDYAARLEAELRQRK